MKLNPVALSFVLTIGVTTAQAAWTQLTPGTVPTPRTGASDSSDITGMLMFGGNSGAGRLDELWRFDPFAVGGATWIDMAPTGTLPAGRQSHGAAYDVSRAVLVVFGGRTASGNGGINADTWEWDAITNTWTDKTPAVPNYGVNTPAHLENTTMVYDFNANHCLLFGGRGNATTAAMETNETWSWDGANWTLLTPLTTSPPVRRNHAMAHDAASGLTMVWGGIASGAALGDTWLWDGSDWTNVPTATIPFANGTHNGSLLNGLAYDSTRERWVLTSGTYPGGTATTDDDTYEFDGNDWINRGSSGMGNKYDAMHTYVEAASKTYRFGGYNGGHQNQTWEYQTSAVATTSSYGTGCAGQNGTGLTLVADNAPWTGDTWSGTCTTMGPASLALSVWGLTTASVPLDVLLPGFGQPGCVLANSADAILGPVVPAAGSVTISLPLPANAALAGQQLHAQVAEIDFTLANLWTSNGVTMTIGVR
tara:strand:- start:9760 stop:11196 length:1437 start_codon:yes stop_codon:yes gene_type:complete